MSVLDSFSLQGKTALVTGCNKGIGFGMTLALAEAGANIIGMSSGGDDADIKVVEALPIFKWTWGIEHRYMHLSKKWLLLKLMF